MIFKDVRDGRPYPDHGFSMRDWAKIPPRQIRLDELVTTKRELRLDTLLDEDSTFYGDLFPHAVYWAGEVFLEDGLHRALRAALQQRTVIHVRVLKSRRPPRHVDGRGRRPSLRVLPATRSPAARSVEQPDRDPVGQQPAPLGQHRRSSVQSTGVEQSLHRRSRGLRPGPHR